MADILKRSAPTGYESWRIAEPLAGGRLAQERA